MALLGALPVFGQTRLKLNPDTAGAIEAELGAGWELNTSAPTRFECAPVSDEDGSSFRKVSFTGEVNAGGAGETGDESLILFQCVTPPLNCSGGCAIGASDTISGMIKGWQGSTDANLRAVVVWKVVAADGTTCNDSANCTFYDYGEANSHEFEAAGAPYCETLTECEAQPIRNNSTACGATCGSCGADTVSNAVTPVSGERIVVEVGLYEADADATASSTHGFWIGNSAAADLDSASTNGGLTCGSGCCDTDQDDPWLELSTSLSFLPVVNVSISGTGGGIVFDDNPAGVVDRISADVGAASDTGNYTSGSNITLSAYADSGSTGPTWSGTACTGCTGATCNSATLQNLTADSDCTVTFTAVAEGNNPATPTLTLDATGAHLNPTIWWSAFNQASVTTERDDNVQRTFEIEIESSTSAATDASGLHAIVTGTDADSASGFPTPEYTTPAATGSNDLGGGMAHFVCDASRYTCEYPGAFANADAGRWALQPNKTYYIRLRVQSRDVNADGEGSEWSAWTPTQKFTTYAWKDPVSGTPDIFVNCETGNDTTGDGSSGTPYQTMGKAISVAAAGNLIRIIDGAVDCSQAAITSLPDGVWVQGDSNTSRPRVESSDNSAGLVNWITDTSDAASNLVFQDLVLAHNDSCCTKNKSGFQGQLFILRGATADSNGFVNVSMNPNVIMQGQLTRAQGWTNTLLWDWDQQAKPDGSLWKGCNVIDGTGYPDDNDNDTIVLCGVCKDDHNVSCTTDGECTGVGNYCLGLFGGAGPDDEECCVGTDDPQAGCSAPNFPGGCAAFITGFDESHNTEPQTFNFMDGLTIVGGGVHSYKDCLTFGADNPNSTSWDPQNADGISTMDRTLIESFYCEMGTNHPFRPSVYMTNVTMRRTQWGEGQGGAPSWGGSAGGCIKNAALENNTFGTRAAVLGCSAGYALGDVGVDYLVSVNNIFIRESGGAADGGVFQLVDTADSQICKGRCADNGDPCGFCSSIAAGSGDCSSGTYPFVDCDATTSGVCEGDTTADCTASSCTDTCEIVDGSDRIYINYNLYRVASTTIAVTKSGVNCDGGDGCDAGAYNPSSSNRTTPLGGNCQGSCYRETAGGNHSGWTDWQALGYDASGFVEDTSNDPTSPVTATRANDPTDTEDFTLASASSTAVDAGHPNYFTPSNDASGGAVDIGAIELTQASSDDWSWDWDWSFILIMDDQFHNLNTDGLSLMILRRQ